MFISHGGRSFVTTSEFRQIEFVSDRRLVSNLSGSLALVTVHEIRKSECKRGSASCANGMWRIFSLNVFIAQRRT